uniref:Protein kinase domain-containing protein n=1 Tax=Tetradesmus obliquus TaxID=3088 RepID=A0A383VQQ0_TETOB|eukprot:jgi/Sobl393_1/13665/SZX67220.1
MQRSSCPARHRPGAAARCKPVVLCRASSSSNPWGTGNGAGTSTSNPFASSSSQQLTPEQLQKRSKELQELLQESLKIAMQTGPRGMFRSIQAGQAVASLAQDYVLSGGRLDPPQVVLRKLFERLGATYIKLGQFIASSPSLFPEEYVLEFQKCLDRTDPVPFATIQRILKQELQQQPLESVFSYIDPQPLASASVAQVHSAVLAGSGKEVVIKVLRPGTEDVLLTDLNFLYLFTRVLEFIAPELNRLSVGNILSDIKASMMDEVDFTKEAYHLQTFNDFLDKRGLRGVATAPYVYRQFSSKRVLVMERLSGVPLTDLASIRAVTSKDPEGVLISALNTWFASVLGADTFHADVHAGNLLVLPDGRVGFIDFGIVGSISPVTWKAMEALLASLAVGDYDTMARALATIGACSEDVDYSAFARDLQSFFSELESLNSSLVVTGDPSAGFSSMAASVEVDQAQVNRLLLDLVAIGERHGIRFPREFGLFVKQLLYFDRYTRILAPELRVFDDARVNWRAPGNSPGSSSSASSSFDGTEIRMSSSGGGYSYN